MRQSKRALLYALILCAAVSLPMAASYAAGPTPARAYAVSTLQAENDPPAGTDNGETVGTVTISGGETWLYDDQDVKIGVLKRDVDQDTLQFSVDGKNEWVTAVVSYAIPNEERAAYLRQSTAAKGDPIQLFRVVVTTSTDNITQTRTGWLGLDRVENYSEIERTIVQARLASQAALAAKETEVPQATPAPTLDPSTLLSLDQKPVIQVQPYMDYAMAFLLFAVTIIVIGVLVAVLKMKRENERTATQANADRESDASQVPTKLDSENMREAIAGIAQKQAAQGAKLEELHKITLEMDKKIPPLPKRVEDWEQLLDIANASTHETYYENWRLAFRGKGWEPQALQPIEQGAQGIYELTAFGKSQYVAVFTSPDRAKQGTVYAIPSCEDRDLRSPQVRELFNMKNGTPANFGVYEIIKPAVLFSDNNRHFRVITKGEIVVFSL